MTPPAPDGGPGEDHRSDAELLSAHVGGDRSAFGVLVHRHRDRLWAVALQLLGDREDAADGLQDGLVAAYRRAGSFRGDAAVTTWLHRVVVNACLDRVRASRVRAAEPMPEHHDPVSTRTDADPVAGVEHHNEQRRVLAALRQLPADQRAAVVLVDMEGYAVADAARVLGCPRGTVKSRCSRARRRLAGLLGDGNQPASPDVPPTGAASSTGREVPPR